MADDGQVAPVFIRLLLLFIPLSLALAYFHQPPTWVFAASIIAIVPLSEYIRLGTEEVSHKVGSAIGGLLNVTFGNAPELILAIFILRAGEAEVVKAQITGAFIGNGLLGLGLAIVAGSIHREKQTFKKERASMLSAMLILCVIALLLPALFDFTVRHSPQAAQVLGKNHQLSLGVAGVLIVVYVANLIYTLVTHRDIFAIDDSEGTPSLHWPPWVSVGVLLLATVFTALEAELVSGALAATSEGWHLSKFFLGIIVLAIVGNIPEKASAIYFARQNRMGLVMTITVGSTIQIALLVAPLIVFLSHAMGCPMDLVFSNPLEMLSFIAVALAVNAISQDGETTWFEGVLLLGVYLMLAMAFFFVG